MHLKTDTGGANAHYAQVPQISHSRNAFSVAEKHLTTMQFDTLFPIAHKFIYPGDTLSAALNLQARLTTQVAVLYDDLYFDVHAWFVPMRLIQTNWARYQFNAQPLGPTQDNSSLTAPYIDLAALGAGGFTSKSLYDYFGYPTKINATASTQKINNYLGRAYNLIWNTNYRDENLQEDVVVDLDEGPDLASDYVLLKRGRRHDRFTSCLPWQQKGTAPTIPLTGIADVKLDTFTGTNYDGKFAVLLRDGGGNMQTWYGDSKGVNTAAIANGSYHNLYADLNTSLAYMLVNDLRTTISVQHLLEADARGGTRDVESIKHRWGVTVPDFRLQRPEYLGGSTFTFDGHVVPQTSATVAGQTPQANLAQFSQSMSQLNITHSFVEHGIFMVLISARSNLTYQEGLQKELSYSTRYDWYQPEFANLGEVAVKNKEIYFQGVDATDNAAFGYNEYAYELRYGLNRVSSEMRSNFTTSRDAKHMADDYSSLPALGATWIQSSTPISRNIAVSASTADPIELNTMLKGTIARTLPMYSVPGLSRL